MTGSGAGPWPLEIRLKRVEKALEIDFDDDATFRYPAELLRVESPSAEVQGHTPSQKVTLAGKRNVGIRNVPARQRIAEHEMRLRQDVLPNELTRFLPWQRLRQGVPQGSGLCSCACSSFYFSFLFLALYSSRTSLRCCRSPLSS